MNKIKVIDNFFTEDDNIKIKDIINDKWKCNCIHNNNINRSISTAYFCINLTNESFFSDELKNIIDNKLNFIYDIIRIMAISQNIYQNCGYHTDHKILNNLTYDNGQDINNNEVTFCYYLNTPNEENEGSIYFKENNHIYSIPTKKGRGIFFPAYMLHSPMAYTNDLNLRICITWKMYYKNNIKNKIIIDE